MFKTPLDIQNKRDIILWVMGYGLWVMGIQRTADGRLYGDCVSIPECKSNCRYVEIIRYEQIFNNEAHMNLADCRESDNCE